MEGVVDWVLRELLSSIGGMDRLVTEFVRVTDRLLPDHVFFQYCPELKQGGRTRAGHPVFVQLLGGQAVPLAANAARAVALGVPGIDLNFGCPAKTVNRHDGGAILLREPMRLFHILRAVRSAVPQEIPVTAKVRLGFSDKELHREIAQAVEEGGADHIVVHARTKMEMYAPPAHWAYIRSMRKGRRIPFFANGEIWSVEDYWRCVEESGTRDVALGRGLVRDPMLAHKIRASVAKREGQMPGLTFDKPKFLRRFFGASLEWRGDTYAVARTKQLLRYWSRDDAQALAWFSRIKVMHDASELKSLLDSNLVSVNPAAICPDDKTPQL